MSKNDLKYAKKNWYNGYLRMLSVNKVEYAQGKSHHEIILYIQERKVMFNCYNPEIIDTLKKVNPQEKIKIWFSAESKEYNKKWYTNLIIKFVEVQRLKEMEKIKEKIDSNSFVFGTNDEFLSGSNE